MSTSESWRGIRCKAELLRVVGGQTGIVACADADAVGTDIGVECCIPITCTYPLSKRSAPHSCSSCVGGRSRSGRQGQGRAGNCRRVGRAVYLLMLLREALQRTHLLRLHRLHLRIRRHTPSLALLHRSLAGCRSVRLRMKNDGLMWLSWQMEMRLLIDRLLTLLLCLRMQVRRPRTLRLRLRLGRSPAVRLYSLYAVHRRCRLWWLRMSSLWLRVYERRWVCRRR